MSKSPPPSIPPNPPDRWALLADCHIDADREARSRHGGCMADHLSRVLEDITAQPLPLEAVLINGDCAHRLGTTADYQRLSSLLREHLPSDQAVHLALGNHDDRSAFLGVFGDSGQSNRTPSGSPVAGKHVQLVPGRQADWIVLDTLGESGGIGGELGGEQLEWLDRHLSGYPARPVILAGHHYPEIDRTDVIPANPAPRIPGLSDGPSLLAIAHRHRCVKAYIHGHSHLPGTTTDDHGLHIINLPSTSFTFQAGENCGWIAATVHSDRIDLEFRPIPQKGTQQGELTTLCWRP